MILDPIAEGIDQRNGMLAASGLAFVRGTTTDLVLDAIDAGDLLEPILGDGGGLALGDFVELTAGMRPAIGELDRATVAFGAGQPVVAGVTVNLQDAAEAFEEALGMLAAATGCIAIGDAWWIGPAPGPIVTSESPLRASRPRNPSLKGSMSADIDGR